MALAAYLPYYNRTPEANPTPTVPAPQLDFLSAGASLGCWLHSRGRHVDGPKNPLTYRRSFVAEPSVVSYA